MPCGSAWINNEPQLCCHGDAAPATQILAAFAHLTHSHQRRLCRIAARSPTCRCGFWADFEFLRGTAISPRTRTHTAQKGETDLCRNTQCVELISFSCGAGEPHLFPHAFDIRRFEAKRANVEIYFFCYLRSSQISFCIQRKKEKLKVKRHQLEFELDKLSMHLLD